MEADIPDRQHQCPLSANKQTLSVRCCAVLFPVCNSMQKEMAARDFSCAKGRRAPIASVVVVVAAAAAATTATAKPNADAAAAVAAVTAAAVSAATAAVTPAAAVANELHVRLFGAFDFLFEDIKCAQAYV
jgi:hypothetical protein